MSADPGRPSRARLEGVAECQEAENALRESEERYRTLVESIDEGFCVIEVLFDESDRPVDYRFVEVNPAFEKHTGIANALGRRMREIAPEHEEQWFEIYGRIALKGESVRFDRPAHALGRWYDVSAFRVGRPEQRRVAVLFRDISRRILNEAALRESEERFRILVQSVQEYAIFLMDPEGRVASWNEGAERILGYSVEEAQCRPGSMFFTEEDRAGGMPERELRTATEQGQAMDENWLVRKGGERFWASGATTALWGEAGALRGFVKILRDLTERKAAEDALQEKETRLRVALSAARMGTWRWDLSTGRKSVDENLRRLFGRAPEEPCGTLDEFLGLVHPDDRSRVSKGLDHAVRHRAPLDLDFRVLLSDGSVRWLRDQGDVVQDKDGNVLCLTGACMDITDRKQAEAARQESEDRLAELNAQLEERVRERTREVRQSEQRLRALALDLSRADQQERRRIATVLHDHVQQLLAATKMHAGILGLDLKGERELRELRTIERMLDEGMNAVRSLSVELAPPLLAERGLSAALVWLGERMEAQHDLMIEVDADPDADPPEGELSELLFQGVRELLFNVVKHAQTERAWVRLRSAEGMLLLDVIDRGVGFDPGSEELEQSFGLLHLRERLRAFGGTLEVEGRPDEGTQATILVPIAELSRDQSDAEAEGGEEAPPLVPERTRVLIVDDHQLLREGISEILRRHADFEIVGQAVDGEMAVARTRELRPDVVIMDVTMPRMNGIDATRLIRRQFPEVRVIGLSLHSQEQMAKTMLEAGASRYLVKNGPADDLVRAIRAVAHHGANGG